MANESLPLFSSMMLRRDTPFDIDAFITSHALWPVIEPPLAVYATLTDVPVLLRLWRNVNTVSRDATEAVEQRLRFFGVSVPPPFDLTLGDISLRLEALEAPPSWRAKVRQAGSFVELQDGAPSDTGTGLERIATFCPVDRWMEYRDLRERYWQKDDGALAEWDGFWAAFDERACSEWGKMDELGVSFGGPWAADDPDAFTLCRELNARALFALPYPKHAVLWLACVQGCCTRLESVPYVRAMCEWFRRVEAACGPYELAAEPT